MKSTIKDFAFCFAIVLSLFFWDTDWQSESQRIELTSFPEEITDITEAIIYTQRFLPSGAQLVASKGEQNGCDYVANKCIERYQLSFHSAKTKDEIIEVMIDFSYALNKEFEKKVRYIKVN